MNRSTEITQGLYEWDLDTPPTEKPLTGFDKTVLVLIFVFILIYGLYYLGLLFGGFYRLSLSEPLQFSLRLLNYRFHPVRETGLVLVFVGFLGIWIQAFKHSLAYGIIMFWLPLLMYLHVYLYFRKAWLPFSLHLLGLALMAIGK